MPDSRRCARVAYIRASSGHRLFPPMKRAELRRIRSSAELQRFDLLTVPVSFSNLLFPTVGSCLSFSLASLPLFRICILWLGRGWSGLLGFLLLRLRAWNRDQQTQKNQACNITHHPYFSLHTLHSLSPACRPIPHHTIY